MKHFYPNGRILAYLLSVIIAICSITVIRGAFTASRSTTEVYLPFMTAPTETPVSMPPGNPSPPTAGYASIPAGDGVAAFRIMRTEVTNMQYAQCVAANACTPPAYSNNNPSYANHPVVGVTRAQARQYAAWVGGKLPTRAQWLRACQGGDGRIWPWGNQPPTDPTHGAETQANFLPLLLDDTTPVASFPTGASPYNVHDMAGNVAEWIDDGSYVTMGGTFADMEDDIMCASEQSRLNDYSSAYDGFRVVIVSP